MITEVEERSENSGERDRWMGGEKDRRDLTGEKRRYREVIGGKEMA